MHQTGNPPREPKELTIPWLNQALATAGLLGRERVLSIDVSELGKGMTGRVARVQLKYETESSAPPSLVAKFPSRYQQIRDLARRFRLYEREARFYRELASRARMPTPRLFYSAEIAPGEFVVLLEDLTDAREGDLLAGCEPEEARRLLYQLADMHAAWWECPELDALDWLGTPNDQAMQQFCAKLATDAWTKFLRDHGDNLPPTVRRIGNGLRRDQSVLGHLSEPPWTLVHGDTRINNMLFTGDKLRALIDWQTAVRSKPACDVACLLVNCLEQADRRRIEAELVPAYQRALEERGVSGYSLDQCWLDYRLEVLSELNQIVVWSSLALGNLGAGAEPASGAAAAASRLFAAVEELDIIDLFPRNARMTRPFRFRRTGQAVDKGLVDRAWGDSHWSG